MTELSPGDSKPPLLRNMVQTALVLALFAMAGGAMVSFVQQTTRPYALANERKAMLATLNTLIPPEAYDNALLEDKTHWRDPQWLGTQEPVTFYRARLKGQPFAVVFATQAPDGYAGAIHLLVAIRYDGVLLGARVLDHHETPGLGDGVELSRSDWMLSFNGRSLDNPDITGWRVKKDGGVFDQFTGATITPRAIVKAIYSSLIFYRTHHEELFTMQTVSQK